MQSVFDSALAVSLAVCFKFDWVVFVGVFSQGHVVIIKTTTQQISKLNSNMIQARNNQ